MVRFPQSQLDQDADRHSFSTAAAGCEHSGIESQIRCESFEAARIRKRMSHFRVGRQGALSMFFLPLLLLLNSCGTTIRTTDATGSDVDVLGQHPHAGNFYFLPRVLIRVSGHYTDDKAGTYQVDISRILQPDGTARLFAEYRPSGSADDTVNFVVNNKGLLDGAFTTESADRTPAIIESLANTAINVWKIASYGPLQGVASKAPAAPGAAREAPKLKSFDRIFDPFKTKSFTVAGFVINVSEIAGVPPDESKRILTSRTDRVGTTLRHQRNGLVFRAPTIVNLSIAHFPEKSGGNDRGGTGEGPPGAASPQTSAADSGGEADLGTATAPTPSNDQKSNNVLSWTIYSADASTNVRAVVAAKVADPRPGAAVPFSFSRACFVKKGTALAFVDGELLGLDIRKPSELLAFVSIPETITTSVLNAIPSILSIKDQRASREQAASVQQLQSQKSLVDAQNSLLQSQITLLNSQKQLKAAREAPSASPAQTGSHPPQSAPSATPTATP